MICTKCGLEVESGAAFCGNCGTQVQVGQAASTDVSLPSMTTQAPPVMATNTPATPTAAVFNPASTPVVAAPSSAPPAPIAPIAVPGGPAYGMPATYSQPGGGKAIAAFVLGIIGLIGWLIPIIGLVLATLSLIFGTMTTKSSHRKLAIAGIVLGSITLVLSLLSFAYNLSVQAKERKGEAVSTSIVTPVLGHDTNIVTPLLQPY